MDFEGREGDGAVEWVVWGRRRGKPEGVLAYGWLLAEPRKGEWMVLLVADGTHGRSW